MLSDDLTVQALAAELQVPAKTMRAWMRRQGWRSLVERGHPWVLSPEQSASLRAQFDGNPEPSSTAPIADTLAGLSVAELLTNHRSILASLKARGLVRTNNAPIGDLAEYAAAIVYDGLLAPNSEKSYDLVAEDGRRIQVKVRLIRPGTSRSAVFSSVRSFDFDGALFLLVDDEAGDVELARELTVQEVREHGRHREHTNGVVLRIGQLRSLSSGVDLTRAFQVVWEELLARRY